MKNHISICVNFDFKGKTHSPSIAIDLNVHIKENKTVDSLYLLLAKSNNIDIYSYEYELLISENLHFSNATGLAEFFLKENRFDFVAFELALQDKHLTDTISIIAKDHLSIDDLASHPELKSALIEAFKLGRKS